MSLPAVYAELLKTAAVGSPLEGKMHKSRVFHPSAHPFLSPKKASPVKQPSPLRAHVKSPPHSPIVHPDTPPEPASPFTVPTTEGPEPAKFRNDFATHMAVSLSNLQNNMFQFVAEGMSSVCETHNREKEILRQQLETVRTQLSAAEARASTDRLVKFAHAFFIEKRKRQVFALQVRIFRAWQARARRTSRRKEVLQQCLPALRRRCLHQTLLHWRRAVQSTELARREQHWKDQMRMATRLVVDRYEETLVKLREQTAAAERALEEQKQRTRRLEARLQQAFLRGVSVLNQEAMEVFQESTEEHMEELRSPLPSGGIYDEPCPRVQVPQRTT